MNNKKSRPLGGGVHQLNNRCNYLPFDLQLFALAYNEVDNPYEFSLIAPTWVKGTNKSTIVYNLVYYYKKIPNYITIEELPADNATYIKNALPNVNDCSCMLGKNETGYPTNGCKSLTSIDSTDWDVSNIKNMSSMFGNCRSLTTLDVSKWNTSNVHDMSSMFYNCKTLTTLDVSKWNTSNVHDMSYMFYYCLRLKTLGISNWDTSKVTDMSYMFYDCASLTSLDISKWDISSVTNMTSMFQYCTSLRTITGVIDMKFCTSYSNMFENCNNLSGVKIKNPPSGFDGAGLTSSQYEIVS